MAKVRRKARRAAARAAAKVGSVYSVSSVAALECERSKWLGLPNHCHWCNKELTGRQTAWCSKQCNSDFVLNHIWSEARALTLRKAKHTCERKECECKTDLQVNHIEPVVGQGYQPSCYHHLDNLEALCRPHHQLETNAQREHRQIHWTDGALNGSIQLPSEVLAPELRQDLIHRMLDRKSGWPFLLPNNDFETTGVYHRYRPNTSWKVALADLRINYPEALVWETKEQKWVTLAYYAEPEPLPLCIGTTKAGKPCSRRVATITCWQHTNVIVKAA